MAKNQGKEQMKERIGASVDTSQKVKGCDSPAKGDKVLLSINILICSMQKILCPSYQLSPSCLFDQASSPSFETYYRRSKPTTVASHNRSAFVPNHIPSLLVALLLKKYLLCDLKVLNSSMKGIKGGGLGFFRLMRRWG
ncbi:ATP-binding protein [Sesbania bispinosa]|nr:ATP-binding protein [Sesbania bispinosa]